MLNFEDSEPGIDLHSAGRKRGARDPLALPEVEAGWVAERPSQLPGVGKAVWPRQQPVHWPLGPSVSAWTCLPKGVGVSWQGSGLPRGHCHGQGGSRALLLG